jgi:hypothetical protein
VSRDYIGDANADYGRRDASKYFNDHGLPALDARPAVGVMGVYGERSEKGSASQRAAKPPYALVSVSEHKQKNIPMGYFAVSPLSGPPREEGRVFRNSVDRKRTRSHADRTSPGS